nr:reverse transcriptase domain-containing protein [Tanacetum cinerariifolium]
MATNRNDDDAPPAKGGDLPVLDLRTMEELCQPTLNGRGGPIAPIAIQETNFRLKNDMIQQVQNSCHIHGLSGDDANKHLDKFLLVTQSIKVNGVIDDALRLTYMLREPIIKVGNNQERNQFFQGASHGQNLPLAYQAPAYQALGYQAPVHQAPIPQPQVVTTTKFTNYMKANDAILKNMQTNMTSLINSNLKIKNMFGQFMKMNTASSSGSRTLPSTTITNPKEDLKGITTRSGIAYKGPMIPTTSSPSKVMDRETEVTKDTVPPTNNGSNKDVQPLHCLAVLLKKLPEKLGDPEKFLIPCDFPRMDECLALADLDASINLMPLSMWKVLSLPELSPMCTNLELADRSISRPVGVTEDVSVKVGKFHFLANFIVVDFDVDTRVPLILRRSYLKTGQILGFFVNGNPTPSTKPIVSTSSPTLTPFGDSDFLLEETNAFLAIEDEPISLEIDNSYYDLEGDNLLLEKFLNDDPSSPPIPPQELKVVEPNIEKYSIDEPPVVELKDLPPHLEYAFLKGDDRLPVIIAKDLKIRRKSLS